MNTPTDDTAKEPEQFDATIEADFTPANHIGMYLHCSRCVRERPPHISPANWAALSVGWTPRGLQVWCERHSMNVCHIDFEGSKHPAITYVSEDMRGKP